MRHDTYDCAKICLTWQSTCIYVSYDCAKICLTWQSTCIYVSFLENPNNVRDSRERERERERERGLLRRVNVKGDG